MMTIPNEFDLIAWLLAAFLFFRGMEYGVRIEAPYSMYWQQASILVSMVKALVTAAPLMITLWANQYQTSPVWDAACLLSIAVFFGPIAFPQLPIAREGATIKEKILQWLIQRQNIVVMKGLALLVLAGIFFALPSCSPSDLLRVTNYFPGSESQSESTFSMATLVVATVSVVLKGMISPNFLVAAILAGIAWLLGGYMFDLAGSMNCSGMGFSIKLAAVVAVDLAIYLWSPTH